MILVLAGVEVDTDKLTDEQRERMHKHVLFQLAMGQPGIPREAMRLPRDAQQQHSQRVAKKAQEWMVDKLQEVSEPQSFAAAIAQALQELLKKG